MRKLYSRIDFAHFCLEGARASANRVVAIDQQGEWTGKRLADDIERMRACFATDSSLVGSVVLLAMENRKELLEAYVAMMLSGLRPLVPRHDEDPYILRSLLSGLGVKSAVVDQAGMTFAEKLGLRHGFTCDCLPRNEWGTWQSLFDQVGDSDLPEAAPTWDGDIVGIGVSRGLGELTSLIAGERTNRGVALTGGIVGLYIGGLEVRLAAASPLNGMTLEAAAYQAFAAGTPVRLLPPRAAELAASLRQFEPTIVFISIVDVDPADVWEQLAPVQSDRHIPRILATVCPDQIALVQRARKTLLKKSIRPDLVDFCLSDPNLGLVASCSGTDEVWRPAATVAVETDDGEVLLRSPQLSRFGYEAHSARFTDSGWFRTGLAGRLCSEGLVFEADCSNLKANTTLALPAAETVATCDDDVQEIATDISMGATLLRSARFHSERTAINTDSSKLQYGEFAAAAAKVASYFQCRLGVKKGDRVAVLTKNRPEFLVIFLASSQIGAIFVPINFRLSVGETEHLLKDSGATVLVAEQEYKEEFPRLSRACNSLTEILTFPSEVPGTSDYEAIIAETLPLPELPRIQDTDSCSIIYTGGTTGLPKGAIRSHKAILWFGLTCCPASIRFNPLGVQLAAAPMFHVAGHEQALLPALACGRRVVVLARFDADKLLEVIEREHVTSSFVPPTMGMDIVRAIEEGRRNIGSLADWSSASASLPAIVRDRMLGYMPHLRFRNSLGMTEAGVVAAIEGAMFARKSTTCVGRVAPYVRVRIVDDRDIDVEPFGIGEIVIRSPQLTDCYHNNEELFEEAIRGDWFHSGDLGMIDEDGLLHVVGRKKDMILTGGENVYAAEVENALLGLTGIQEVAVVGVPDERWGEVVAAAIVLKPGSTISDDQVLKFCRGLIAHYKCPKKIAFLTTLPKTAIGKVEKSTVVKTFTDDAVAAC